MTIQIAGTAAIAFGQNKPHLRSLLQQACCNQGWPKMINRPPSKHAALERAMQTVCRALPIDDDAILSVRALSQGLSFEATRVRKGATRNTITHLASARVLVPPAASAEVQLLSWNPQADGARLLADLEAEYSANLHFLTATQLYSLVASVVRKIGGVGLGGRNVFYIPASGLHSFSTWLQDSKLDSYHVVPLETAKSPDTVKHILDQLNLEVAPEAEAILSAVATGSLEPRSAKAMIKRAQGLIAKIKSYESALGQQLDWMRQPLEQAEQALAVSTLMSVSV